MAKVDYCNDEYRKFEHIWKKCLDAYEGQEAIKKGRDIYLPMLSGQKNDSSKPVTANDRDRGGIIPSSEYDEYLRRAVYYNYVKKITNGLGEQLFRKNVKIKVPPKMQIIVDKFTYAGKSFKTAVKESNRNILLNYRHILMLDIPRVEEQVLTVADKERMNIRPYAVYYNAEDIINWRYEIINNTNTLSMVVIKELVEEYTEDEEFEPESILQYRVLSLDSGRKYVIRIYRQDDSGEFEIYDMIEPIINGKRLDFIPCFFLTEKGISQELDFPMMNDAVDINIAHYINSADYENSLNQTGSPTPVIKGYESDPEYDDEQISLGNRVLQLGVDGDAKFLEFQGKGPESLADAMNKKVDALSVIAGRMLQNDPKGIESAETAQIHRTAEQGQLASMAVSLSESYEYIFNIIADWMKVTGDIEIMFNTDFIIEDIDPQLFSGLNNAIQAGNISFETYFYNLLKNEMIPEDWTIEDEREAIARAGMDQLAKGFEEEEK